MAVQDAVDIYGDEIGANPVTSRIILGSRPEKPEHLQWLRDTYAVNAILNVCLVDDCAILPDPNGLGWHQFAVDEYRFNPTVDDMKPKPVEFWRNSLQFAMALLAVPGNVLYVHCESGSSRSSATVYCILRAWGFSRADCVAMLNTHRLVALGEWYFDSADAAIAAGW